MREKARRMLLGILILTGSLAAYPQNNFPNHLVQASEYWQQVYNLSKETPAHEFGHDWQKLSQTDLTKDQEVALTRVMLVVYNLPASFPKEEKLFISKYGYLAIYLSGLNPLATLAFNRSGPWMLTYPDARRYGLRIDEYVDERNDLEKSTRAARLLFDDLKEIHGANTEAAFVHGSAGFKRANQEIIDRTEENLTALRIVSKGMKSENLIANKQSTVPQSFQEDIDLIVLLSEVSITESQFRRWNPMLIGSKVPARQKVVLPSYLDEHQLAGKSRDFLVSKKRAQDSVMLRIKNDIPSPETNQVITYRVKSGDVLGKISERYGVSVSKIKKWNNLRSDRIDINQKLTIYYPKGKSVPTAIEAKPAITKPVEKTTIKEEKGTFTIYEVQAGDTLWAISKRFEGVKPEQIMAWNGIGEDLSIGQKLKIKVVQ